MTGEPYDYAVVFTNAIKSSQEEGKKNRKLFTPEKIKELLTIDLINKQMPITILDLFISENIYVRKLRGQNMFGVWWQDGEKKSHGRGVKK